MMGCERVCFWLQGDLRIDRPSSFILSEEQACLMCWPVLASIKLVRSLRVEAFVIRLIDRSGSGTRRLSATLLIALRKRGWRRDT